MLFSRPGSLSAQLRRTSHLAYCDELVRCWRNEQKCISSDLKTWVFSMFCMGPDRQYDDDIGTIAHWMRHKYPDLYEDISKLSCKLEHKFYKNVSIEGSVKITNTDWDLMRNGVEQYRRHLIYNVDHCDCF